MVIKRQFKRAKIPLLVSIQKGNNDLFIAMLTDLSVGGARFTSGASLSPEARLAVILKLPWRDSPLFLNAKVTRSRKIKGSTSFEVACQFLTLNPGEAEEIARVIYIFEGEERLHRLLESSGYE